MTNPRQIAGDINAYVGSTFEVALDAQTGSTGNSWALAHMPDSINLIDIRHETKHSAILGSSSTQVFVFAAIKTDQSYITFNLIRPWIPNQPHGSKTFALIIVDKPKNLEQDLEATLGSCRFADSLVGQSNVFPGMRLYDAPIDYQQAIPYGIPLRVVEDPEKCLLAYGTPDGVATSSDACVLKYGFPLHMQDDVEKCHIMYGFPVVKYGFPAMKYGVQPMYGIHPMYGVHHLYGIPVLEDGVLQVKPSDDNCILKYGCPVEIIDDPQNCIVKYGFPTPPDTCLVKYGCPVEVKEDPDNCVVKYGIPTGVAPDMKSCILKYGFPVSIKEDPSQCILKYGAPPVSKE